VTNTFIGVYVILYYKVDKNFKFRNTRLGDRSFAAAGPRVWNSLPTQLHYTPTISTSTQNAFGRWQLQRRVTVFIVRCVQIRLLTCVNTNCICI